jgi:hypothetical protein
MKKNKEQDLDKLYQLNYDIATKVMKWTCENYETGEKVSYWNERSNGESLDPALDDGFVWVGWSEPKEAHQFRPCFDLSQAKIILEEKVKDYAFVRIKNKYKLEFTLNNKKISNVIDSSKEYAESILICESILECYL